MKPLYLVIFGQAAAFSECFGGTRKRGKLNQMHIEELRGNVGPLVTHEWFGARAWPTIRKDAMCKSRVGTSAAPWAGFFLCRGIDEKWWHDGKPFVSGTDRKRVRQGRQWLREMRTMRLVQDKWGRHWLRARARRWIDDRNVRENGREYNLWLAWRGSLWLMQSHM